MIETILPETLKFENIIHIADIHIPIFKRHDEYREIFDTFLRQIKEYDKSKTFLVIAGDLFHTKISLAPETVDLASDFLRECADTLPTIVVAGNHDANMLNKNRLDSITPIVSALKHDNLFYLKNSGLYAIGNVLINNYSIFDDTSKYLKGKDIPNIYRNKFNHVICIYHGPINGTRTELGYEISNPEITKELFDDHDIVLLGDIHLYQVLQEYDKENGKPVILYPGTLCQQNFGEPLNGHGYVLWTLLDKTFKHIELNNNYGFITVDIIDGSLSTLIEKYPKNTRLRVKCKNSIPSEVKDIIQTIKDYTNLIEVIYFRDESDETIEKTVILDGIKLDNLNNIEFQNKLLENYLKNKLKISDESFINNVLKLNESYYKVIKDRVIDNCFRWKPIKLEWDNLFAYGEGNCINFENMNGVYGIFSENAAGKSSILSSLLYVLFDKFERANKSINVLNTRKSSFRCKFEFEVDSVRYFIERNGTLQKNGSIKVDVRFWRNNNGVEEELSGLERRNTNDIIRDYVGTYDDFILTAISFQTSKNNASFIDMGHTERKDLLVKFIGLDLYDGLLENANERYKEIQVLLKHHANRNYEEELKNYLKDYSDNDELSKSIQENITALNEKLKLEEEILKDKYTKLVKLESNVPTDFNMLSTIKTGLENKIRDLEAKEIQYSETFKLNESKLNELDVQLNKIISTNFSDHYKQLQEVNKEIHTLKQEINIKKVDIKNKIDKVEKLKTHEYDPNCKYCVNNKFVKDALQAQTDLIQDKTISHDLMNRYDLLESKQKSLLWAENSYNLYNSFLSDKNKINSEHNRLNKDISDLKLSLSNSKTKLLQTIRDMELYTKNEESIKINSKIYTEISKIQEEISLIKSTISNYTKEQSKASSNAMFYKKQSDVINKTLSDIKSLELEYKIYQAYISAISRDGIPFQVISTAIPTIEREVNSILTQLVDYTIQFESDGKNIIPYISYMHGRWPIELMSGFERFVSSIAIRVALTNISNLPKSNFLAIDEGFATLDSNNLQSMKPLFGILSQSFDFIMIISHLDTMKDTVDKHIEIVRDSNFSKVNFDS